MVRLSLILARIPVIKFRKGGIGPQSTSAGSQAPGAAAAPSSASVSSSGHQSMAAMSTGPINDTDLPHRYRRTPMSQEEMDYINGGGIV